MKSKRLIVVLGMHRSGSSAITKGLEVMGVNLGTHLMSADANNEKGYFEDIELNQLNNEILKASGHEWNSLSLIQESDLLDDKLSRLKDRAIEVLKEKLADTDLLGIKDPRFCRLLPFWKDVFSDLKLDVSYVIILRDPESIAASLFARDAYPRVKALYLWLEHMVTVFRETRTAKRSVVDFENLLARPKVVIETLAKDLKLSGQLNKVALKSYENEFIDVSLKHHQRESDLESGFTARLINRLDVLLNKVSEQKISIDSAEFMDKINEIEEDLKDKADILAYIDTLDSIILRNHFNLKNTNLQLDDLTSNYDLTKGSLESKKKLLTQRNAQIKSLKTDIANRDKLLASVQNYLSDREMKIEALEINLTNRDSTIGALQQSLSGRDVQIDSLEQSLSDSTSKIDALGQSMSERDAQIHSLKQSLSDSTSKIDALGQSLSERDSTLERVETLLRAKKAEINSYTLEINDLQQQFETNVSDTEALAANLDEIKSSLFWRLSVVSRKFWHFVEFIFTPKKEKFHLIPSNELKRVRVMDHSWRSTGYDPYFKLVPLSGKIPVGWTRIETWIQSEARESELKLYLDLGDGLSEKNAATIPVAARGRVDEIIHLPENLKMIRWDPTQHRVEFKQLPIIFSKTGWLRRKLHMIGRVANVLLNTPSETKKENGLTWKMLVSNLNQAYEKTRPIIVSKNMRQKDKINLD